MNATIYRSSTGERVGSVGELDFKSYESAKSTAEGHVRAGDILERIDLDLLGLEDSESVYVLID